MPAKEFLVLKRHLNTRPAQAFRAFSDPEMLRAWWGPDEDDENIVVDVDVRVGGNYHILTQAPNGDYYDFTGEYREVVPNKKICFTWSTGVEEEEGSTVTAEVKPDGDGTELTLTHQGLATASDRDGCIDGWEGALEKLERLVAHH